MHTLTFSDAKRLIAEFHAEALEAERQPGGLLLTAHGEMAKQDTALLENFLQPGASCHVHLAEGDAEVLNGKFEVIFLVYEKDNIIVLLS